MKYKVITDYPCSPFEIGDILEWNGIWFGANEPQKWIENPEKYPHIFQEVTTDFQEVISDFQAVVSNTMKYLAENHSPHCILIIRSNIAEIFDGSECFTTDKFIKD